MELEQDYDAPDWPIEATRSLELSRQKGDQGEENELISRARPHDLRGF